MVLGQKHRAKKTERPDSTRYLPIVFFLIFLFLSYLFWAQ